MKVGFLAKTMWGRDNGPSCDDGSTTVVAPMGSIPSSKANYPWPLQKRKKMTLSNIVENIILFRKGRPLRKSEEGTVRFGWASVPNETTLSLVWDLLLQHFLLISWTLVHLSKCSSTFLCGTFSSILWPLLLGHFVLCAHFLNSSNEDLLQRWGTDDCEYYILTLYEIVGGGNFVQYRVVSLASLAKSQRSRNLPHAYLLEYHQKLVLFPLEHI